MGPMPLRKFEQLVKTYECHIERSTKEWVVVDAEGNTVVLFAVTHGGRTKSNEVKPFYVKRFLKAMKNVRGMDNG